MNIARNSYSKRKAEETYKTVQHKAKEEWDNEGNNTYLGLLMW